MSELTFAKIRAVITNLKKRGKVPTKIKLAPLDYKRFGELAKELSTKQNTYEYAAFHGLRVVADDRVPNGEIWIV